MSLISREAVINIILQKRENNNLKRIEADAVDDFELVHRFKSRMSEDDRIKAEVYNLPFVENKGEWIPVIDSYYEDGTQKESHWECSKCGSRGKEK